MHTTSSTPRPSSPGRILAFVVVTVLVALLLLILQNGDSPLAVPAFLAVIIGGVGLAITTAPAPVRRIILTPRLVAGVIDGQVRGLWKSFRDVLAYYHISVAAVTAYASLLLMLGSAHIFNVTRVTRDSIGGAVLLMLVGGAALGVTLWLARPNIALPVIPALGTRVFARLNPYLTGLGIIVLLFVSETNGRATGARRIYNVTTDTQFWLLILGISLVVMGFSGWQPLFRLPPLKWRSLLLGIVLVIASETMTLIVSFGVFQQWANELILAAVFVVVRLGDLLVLWAFVPRQVRLPRLTRRLSRRNIALVVGALIFLYIIASLSATIFLDLVFALAVNQTFWVVLTMVSLVRVPIAAIYRRITAESQPENAGLASAQSLSSRLMHYALLITILLVAIFARFYLLSDTMRFLIDEDSFITATHYLRAVPNIEILSPFSSIAAFPYVFPYWQMHVVDVIGKTFTGLRGTSAILGVLGVAALYFLARTLFDRKTALLAALFLAVLPVHLQFSRIGISEIASPFFATLAFAFIGRGLLHDRRADFAIGGAMLGLTHYFHEGGRLLYTPLTLTWVAVCIIFTARSKIAPPRSDTSTEGIGVRATPGTRNLFIGLITLVIVAAPIYYTLIAINRPIFARMVDNNSGLNKNYWQSLSDPANLEAHLHNHIMPAFQVYVNQVDNTLFYADQNAFILPSLIPIFLLGVFYAVWRWRAPGTLLVLMWLLSTSVGNSLMVDSAGSPRYVMVFPALALTCAVGLRYVLPLLLRNPVRARNVMVIVAVAFAVVQVNYYFNDHLPAYNNKFRVEKANPDGYDAALRSRDFPVGTNIHIISENLFTQIEGMGMLSFMRDDLYLDTLKPEELTDKYISELRCRVDHAFFIERTDFRTLDKLRANFFLRDAQLTPYDDFKPSQRLILFYAPYMKGSEKLYGRKC